MIQFDILHNIHVFSANQEVLGRASIDLRICACPGRDRKTEEGKLEAQRLGKSAAASPQSTISSPVVTAPPHTQSPPVYSGASQIGWCLL